MTSESKSCSPETSVTESISPRDLAASVKRAKFMKKFDWAPLEPGEVSIALLDDSAASSNYSPSALVLSLNDSMRYGLSAGWRLIERARRYESNHDGLVRRLHAAYDPYKARNTNADDILTTPETIEAVAEFEVMSAVLNGNLKPMRRGSSAFKNAIDKAMDELADQGGAGLLGKWDSARLSAITARRFWRNQLESIAGHPQYEKIIAASQILTPEDLEAIEYELQDEYVDAEV
jgi:hypothetical protein